jgi:hypothetical protein
MRQRLTPRRLSLPHNQIEQARTKYGCLEHLTLNQRTESTLSPPLSLELATSQNTKHKVAIRQHFALIRTEAQCR